VSTQVPQLREHLARLYPGYRVAALEPLAPDTGATSGSSAKAAGYGLPIKVRLVCDRGDPIELVWRVASSNEFGHDRRADRAASMVLAFDDFNRVPHHVDAIDLGAIDSNGGLVSIRDGSELYLITTYAPGNVYADDLRRIARQGRSTELDHARVDALAHYLAELHATPLDDAHPLAYRRAIRDLIGHGEGIFGIIDGYPPIAGAPAGRLRLIEQKCVEWRWRLREHEGRLARTHGDFHPFNIVFESGTRFTVLDASRGTCGDPADDVVALAINFLLFSLESPHAWRALGPLWHRFWDRYLVARPDRVLQSVAPPFFAWRALVVCNPRFYPSMTAEARDKLLGLAECALDTHHFDPAWADELFRCAA
jgi:hypothetical protein